MNKNGRKVNSSELNYCPKIDNIPEIDECVKTSIVPDDEIHLKILTNMTNTLTNCGKIYNTAKISNVLGLCEERIIFSNLSCISRKNLSCRSCSSCLFCLNSDINSIVLAIPLTFTEKCNAYTIILPDIDSKKSFKYENNVIIENARGIPVPVDLQVKNGYLYFVIYITPVDFVINNGNECQMILSFKKFNFNLNKSIVFGKHNVLCKPIIWNYGKINQCLCNKC